jgi:hypothetical protein
VEKREGRRRRNKRGRTLSPGVGEADSRMVEVLIVIGNIYKCNGTEFSNLMYVWAYYSWKQGCKFCGLSVDVTLRRAIMRR